MAKIKILNKVPAFLVMNVITVAALSAVTLSGCMSTTGGRSAEYGQILSPKAQLYADYLSASYASGLGDAQGRADYFSRAFARRPDDLVLGRKALSAAINNGDSALARTLAIEILTLDATDGTARAVLGASAMRKGKYKKAMEYLVDMEADSGVENFNTLMRGWAQVGLGDTDAALVSFDGMQGGKYFEFLGLLQRAKVSMQLGKTEEAASDFAAIDEVSLASIESVLSQARGFMQRGEKDKALEKLKAYADDNGGSLTGPVRMYIDALESSETLAQEQINWEMTPAQSASRAVTESAFRYYAAQRLYVSAETYLRIALELDPSNEKARLFLGSVLEQVERDDEALLQYAKIPQLSAYSVSARLSESDLLFGDDKNDEGIKVLESIQASHPTRVTQGALGRAYLIMEEYGKALPYYEALIAEMSEDELKENPQVKYLRGICLERLGRWEEAVTEFEYVLKHKPENADALNYLGYTWVDKGVNLTKAFGMIEKAVELEPKSGAIIDSLGWAHYKLGQYGKARINLEEAAERSPTSATIIDHLGDVYWKLGRRKEAGYQWERAESLDPTDKELVSIKAKIKGGLSAAVQ